MRALNRNSELKESDKTEMFTDKRINNSITFVLAIFSFSILIFTITIRLFSGSGKENIIYQLSGIYVGKVFLAAVAGIILSFLLNNHIRSAIITALMNKEIAPQSGLNNERRLQSLSYILINYIFFGLLSLYYFKGAEGSLFLGVDGDYMLSITNQQKNWSDSFYLLGGNFLQGVGGNIWFPINTLMDIGYIIGNTTKAISIALAHTAWALALFTSTFVLAKTVKLNHTTAILAAWMAPCLIIFPGVFQISAVPQLIPHISSTIAISTILIALIISKGEHFLFNIFRSVSITVTTLYFIFHNPSFTIVAAPLLFLCAIIKIISLENNKARLIESCVLSAPILFLASADTIQFLLGLFLNTAIYVFPNEFIMPPKNLRSISILFRNHVTFSVVILAMCGLFSTFKLRSKLPQMAILSTASSYLILLITIFGYLSVTYTQSWNGPTLNYFEFFLWPIYAIYISFFVMRVLQFLDLKKAWSKLVHFSEFLPIFFILFYAGLGHLQITPRHWVFPPPDSPIMNQLMENSHIPGNRFKGRVATFTGLNIEGPVSWRELQKFDFGILNKFNNDFRKAGLWIHAIPTLTEYSPFITPRFFFFTKSTLGLDGDRQIRNMMTLRKVSQSHLRLLGVNRIVTDMVFPDLELEAVEQFSSTKLYLYSLKDPNLGNFSPTKLVQYSDFAGAIRFIKSDGFDPRTTLVVERSFDDMVLVPATSSELAVGKNKYIIKSKSTGISALLLPIEYSSCFNFSAKSDGSFSPILFPGNLLFVAILFEKNLRATLSYRNGPFINSDCRINDYLEFRKSYRASPD